MKLSPEVLALYAKARLHDRLQRNAYQGNKELTYRLYLLVRAVLPAYEHISKLNQPKYDVRAVELFGLASQKVELHDYALLTRQTVVSRRSPPRFLADDHPLIAESLRAIAPGEASEAALKRLAGSKLQLYQYRDPK